MGVEALSRFNVDPVRTPDIWFAEAATTGLGIELEMVAVLRALDCLSSLPAGMALTINAGPDTILSTELFDALARGGFGRRVIIELTEHSIVDDYPGLMTAIIRLRRQGVRLAVDDTGAGFASLAHILKLAPDFIKLDRELVDGIDLDPVRRALATALVAFAAQTGAEILAEGVETEEELEAVRALGIRYAQGFLIGRPAPVGSISHPG
jgi:EAL domain-containing protein (putative c-di-GMP-specific phosphodiesterase class I)